MGLLKVLRMELMKELTMGMQAIENLLNQPMNHYYSKFLQPMMGLD
jgi:hypothetical protein